MQQLILIDRQLKGLLCIKVVVVEGTIIVKLILKGQQIQEGILYGTRISRFTLE